MFSNLFGEKENWKVEVIKAFEDTEMGMGYDEWVRKVPVGETGKATISSKGKIEVIFDNVKDTPRPGPLKLKFNKESEKYGFFKWIKEEVGADTESKVKKSSIFS